MRRRLCFPVVAALENCDRSTSRYSLRQLALQPILLSSRRRAEPDARAKGLAFSLASWLRQALADLRWLGQPISWPLSTPLLFQPVAVCVLIRPISLNPHADAFRVDRSSSLTSSAS